MSIVSRVSTFSVFSNTLRDVTTTQNSLFDLQKQISSGLKTDRFAGLPGQVEQFTFLETKIKKAQAYYENNSVAVSRLKTADVSLDKIVDVADDMRALMTLRNTGEVGTNIQFAQQMKSMIESLASELNTTFEGKFIFGGTRSNVPPVKTDPSVPQPITFGTLDDGYYQGSKEDVTVRASDTVELTPNIRADAEAFQKLIHAANLSIKADAESDMAQLKQAYDMLQSGQEDLNAVQADVKASILTLTDINSRHEALKLYWKGVTEEISKTDILAASTKIAVDQSVLQASFQSFSLINSLHLSNFLK